jgi:hypothetical protein
MVFSTWFYIVVLFFQSLIAESNSVYNQQIQSINQLIYQKKYPDAYRATEQLEIQSIFTNNDLMRLKRNLMLHVNVKNKDTIYKPRTFGDYVIKSLDYYQNKQYDFALDLIRLSMTEENANMDSLICYYEIIAFNKPQNSTIRKTINRQASLKQLRINEALNILDLMKRKEKTFF